jgi:hypothetical protein
MAAGDGEDDEMPPPDKAKTSDPDESLVAGVDPKGLQKSKKPPLRYDLGFYNQPVGTYKSKDDFKKVFCCGRHVKGHKPLFHTSQKQNVLYVCSLRESLNPCPWAGMLVFEGDGVWALRVAAGHSSAEHNDASEPKTFKVRDGHRTHGLDSVEQIQALQRNISSATNVRPRQALRSCMLNEEPDAVDCENVRLSQVQGLKKRIGENCADFDYGDFAQLVQKLTQRPVGAKNENKGFFAVAEVLREPQAGKRSVRLVATTPKLQRRWTEAEVCGMDGGHKFCIMKWPVVTWSAVNDAQQGCCVALGLFSRMHIDFVSQGIGAWNASTQNGTGERVGKAFGVSDSEDCFAQVISKQWGAEWIMCWFHVKKADVNTR